jgi:glycosyltransferase involved in cell wall biosynthesis
VSKEEAPCNDPFCASHESAMQFPEITVISVTYQSAGLAPRLADSLRQFAHVVVVDNASTDDTVARLREALPRATVMTNPRNLGFGAANNLGVQTAQTPFVLLLNPDCNITPEAIQLLLDTRATVSAGRHHRTAVVDAFGPDRTDVPARVLRKAALGAVCAARWRLQQQMAPWQLPVDSHRLLSRHRRIR